MDDSTQVYRNNVDKKLIVRQRIFFVIVTILIIVSFYNVVTGKIDVLLAISGFLLSTIIGLAVSRMFKIFWHEEKGKVISELDLFGTLLLILYIGIELSRKWIFQHWLAGAELNAFGFIILTGLLLGRFLGTGLKIKSELERIEDDIKPE